MISIRITYYPPVGSEEEIISMEKWVTAADSNNANFDVLAMVTDELFYVLRQNSAEMANEYQPRVKGLLK